MKLCKIFSAIVLTVILFGRTELHAQQSPAVAGQAEKIIIDTDIGGDIDDAFAIALALRSPELDILGITTDSGDTEARARLLDRMLGEAGRQDIPVAAGIRAAADLTANRFPLSQGAYGETGRFARASHPNAIDFIAEQIERYPGEITLVTIGPLLNIGKLIDRNPTLFRKLKRVVIMGGFIEPIKPDYGSAPPIQLHAEWNIVSSIDSAQKLFESGVLLYVMPLDSTIHLSLDEVKRGMIFAQDTPLTNALMLLYHQWSNAGGGTPILYDAMPIAYILQPDLCPVRPMRIRVDERGFTREGPGLPNAQVCLHSDSDAFFRFYMSKLLSK